MSEVLHALTRSLEPDARFAVTRRAQALYNELLWATKSGSELERLGWTKEAAEGLCGLGAFYQIVLIPLAASAPKTTVLSIPIQYGSLPAFDKQRNGRVRSAVFAFLRLAKDVGLSEHHLTAGSGKDLADRLRDEQEPPF